MKEYDTPAEVAATIKQIIKEHYGNLHVYALEKHITPAQLYSLLTGKQYLSLFSAYRFADDFDINIEYSTKGTGPVLGPHHQYDVLVDAALAFFYAVSDEDKLRDEYESKQNNLSEEDIEQYRRALHRFRIEKAKTGCELVDLLNISLDEDNPKFLIERPMMPKNTMKLHEAIQEVIRQSGHPLTFTEIARLINQQKLYTRKDGLPVPSSQISARVKNYQELFTVNTDVSPKTVKLK